MRMSAAQAMAAFLREILNTAKASEHEHVVRVMGLSVDGPQIYLIMERARGR
jgi:hypothetical protein